jgi:very-short-patch-repair endonuclease
MICLPEAPARRRQSEDAEELFAQQCVQYRLPRFIRNFPFARAAMGRNWEMDYAWPEYQLGVEIDGSSSSA